ncbi:MAG: hypothetical protein IIC75_04405 [Bacteroidetes bacterium]|nr:hypothetical protein [Bacteroidota bacterium]
MIEVKKTTLYWNYYLALEKDLEVVARYIEFSESNWNTYSIELARLLLAVSSEVDVVIKEICKMLDPSARNNNIVEYKKTIKEYLPALISETVYLNRYGLKFQPWIKWDKQDSPNWWQSYNKVKHERNQYYEKANLQNILNAFGALLITNIYYYKAKKEKEENNNVHFKEVTRYLVPESTLLRLAEDYYYDNLIVG